MRKPAYWMLAGIVMTMLGCVASEEETKDAIAVEVPTRAGAPSPSVAASPQANLVGHDVRARMRDVLTRQGLALKPLQRADGLREVRLRDRLHHAQAATRAGDGSWVTTCVDGADAFEHTIPQEEKTP